MRIKVIPCWNSYQVEVDGVKYAPLTRRDAEQLKAREHTATRETIFNFLKATGAKKI